MRRFRNHVGATTVLIFLAVGLLAACTSAPGRRSALLETIEFCLDLNAPGYCTACPRPRVDSACAAGRGCAETTEVWEETNELVVIRDRKMCGCSEDFIHGLALPRMRVTGIEDRRKPDSIWSFAWKAAQKKIPEQNEIALAVNPAGNRSQDQLHVHIARLVPGIRGRFAPTRTARVRTLDDVWKTAARAAEQAGLRDYGILVVANGSNGFIIVVDRESMEKKYTLWGCR
jgi:CDP-diacylglycerol pyrophosphatase